MRNNNKEKQIFGFTIVGYIGTLIGIVSTVYVYPNDKALLGVFRFVDTIAQLMFPLMVFGAGQALIYFQPKISDANKKTLFEYGLITILAISFVLFVFVIFLGQVSDFKNYKYVYYAFPMAFCLAFIELFRRQAINMKKLALPAFFEKIIPKLALPIIFILVLISVLDIEKGLVAFIMAYGIIFVLLAFYVFKRYPIQFHFRFKNLFSEVPKKSYYSYSFFGFLGSFGSLLAFRLDTLMIPQFLSFEANGTYSIGVVLASVIAIPATGVFAYYSPIVSKYLELGDFKTLSFKYAENAKWLFFIGALFYGSVFLGIDALFQFFPTYDKLVDSIPVIMVLGANVVFNMGTGFSSEIISFSKFYKTNILLLFILVFINVTSNIYVLTQTDYGLLGVAWASFIALTVFNVVKLIFIYNKFQMLPFDKSYLKLIVLLIVLGGLFNILPETSNNLINLLMKSGLFVLLSIFLVYKLKLVNSLVFFVNKFFVKTNS